MFSKIKKIDTIKLLAPFNAIYCQICDIFITEEQWNKHLFSNRHLEREVNGYWPTFFSQRKLTRNEIRVFERAFWEMIFGSEDDLPVYGFLKTYIMMVTNMKDYITLDLDDDDADFRHDYRDTIIARFKQDSYHKSFSLQDQNKSDQTDTFWNNIRFLEQHIIDMGCPIPDIFYDHDYDDDGLDGPVRGPETFLEIRKEIVGFTQI